jgi:hypothetical protein
VVPISRHSLQGSRRRDHSDQFAEHAFAGQPGIAQQAIVSPVPQHFQRGIDRRPPLLLPRL